ncbi:GDSL-like lipase/acylhydrolase family protein [Flavobacterium limicola]|uniref:GDSL-like lipase/acylhydrolase family protein n=1 Tax=Flavobacterium limicola TaxID=180441 RepID=A0A495S4C4_9FLAO|nr:SGNH/GDSL hydrolase family protein [Flavobacterium limicola]RKS94683.1 GDSL-like lipase/acylhydrolase family protein [Flavobacterium limicola]
MIKNFKWLLFASLAFVACNNEDEVIADANSSDGQPLTAGLAVVTKYVALGDSYAAGFSDNALFIEGQKGSYANIIGQQFALTGGGEFKTPLMADNVGGLLFGGNVILNQRLFFNGVAPAPVTGRPSTEVTTKLAGPFSNLGVPGAKSYHLVAQGYGNVAGVATGQANPYFARFATSATTSVVADAVAQDPTFFSLWIGGNDVLGYATSGGSGRNQTGNMNAATYASNDITDPAVFAGAYNSIVDAMTAKGAKGVVANLPYVTALPYFTTVPFNPLTASVLGRGNVAVGTATIQGLNAQLYGPLKQALTAFGAGSRIELLSTTAANPLLILDESLPNLSAQLTAAFTPTLGAPTAAFYGQVFGQARQATKEDLVVLTAQTVIASAPAGVPAPLNVFGVTYPMQDVHVLTKAEVAEVKVATDAYNATIKSVADAKGLAFVELKGVTDQLANGGIIYNNYKVTSAFVTGGMFSLDGVHPSPRGYAIIANLFTGAINAKFGANFKNKDVSLYRILYPATL